MQARYYDPVIGRFLSEDPMDMMDMDMNPGYFNRYAYTFNDPINAIDPDGRAVQLAAYAGYGYLAYRVGKLGHKAYKAYRATRPVTGIIPTIAPEVTPTDNPVSGTSVSSSERPKPTISKKSAKIAKRVFAGPKRPRPDPDERKKDIQDKGLEDDILEEFTPDEIIDAMDEYEDLADHMIEQADRGRWSEGTNENMRRVHGGRKEIAAEVRKQLGK